MKYFSFILSQAAKTKDSQFSLMFFTLLSVEPAKVNLQKWEFKQNQIKESSRGKRVISKVEHLR